MSGNQALAIFYYKIGYKRTTPGLAIPEWTGEFRLKVNWGHKFRTNQKVPFKHCCSFRRHQKCHPYKVTLFFQDFPHISRAFTVTKWWEATPWPLSFSHGPLKGSIHFPKLHSESKGQYSSCLQPPTKAISGKIKKAKASAGYGPSCHSQKDCSSTVSLHQTSFCAIFFFLLWNRMISQPNYWGKKSQVGWGKKGWTFEIPETKNILVRGRHFS